MCGIAGIVHTDPQARVDVALLQAMNTSLAHRGPDGEGTFVCGPVGLAHRRLSIIDLVSGDQPIFNEDRSVAIVFNGEIYNYKELRQDLAGRGHRLSTASDTEVIVHLYEDHGDDCLDRLNGMFAFALWDARRARLLAARDRMGEKPLYYCEQPGRLLLASELKAILQDPSVRRELDLEALDDYLALGYVPAPRTIFKSVRKLRAGERLIWESGRARTETYWLVRFDGDGPRDEAAGLEELERLLADSVRLRLRSDVPVGAFLSGGLDSSGIVAFAARELGRSLQTFSVGFGEADFDELARARLTASRYRTDHHEIIVRDTDVSIFGELVAHFDEPFADASMLPTYAIAREARRFVKVCVSGDAGDELFAGYPHYRQARRYHRLDWIPLAARRALCAPLDAVLPEAVPGKGLLGRLGDGPRGRYQRQVGLFAPEERRRLLQPDLGVPIDAESRVLEPLFRGNSLDPVSRYQFVDQNTYLPEDVLVKVDRAAMRSALEVRIPFLDHRLVDLVNSMPVGLKLKGGTSKWILRRLLAPRLPSEVLTGPKQGFGIPIKHWFRGGLRDFARDLLLSPSRRSEPFLRRSALVRLLDGHETGGRDLSDRIWALLVFEEWCRRFSA